MKKTVVSLLVICLLVALFAVVSEAADKTVAVVDFTNTTDYYLPNVGEMAAETLSIMVSQMEGFNVVERAKLNDIILEQRFSKSGLVDNTATAIQMGKLLGAEYIVTGSIINLAIDESTFEGFGIKTTQTIVTMDVSVKMLNVNTGVIELADIYTSNKTFQDSVPSNMVSVVRDLLKNSFQKFVVVTEQILNKPVQEIKNAYVEFISTPLGADIEIDGIYMGSTPATIPVTEGIHVVKISLGGYEIWEKKVLFFEGLKVNVTLTKKAKLEEGDQ